MDVWEADFSSCLMGGSSFVSSRRKGSAESSNLSASTSTKLTGTPIDASFSNSPGGTSDIMRKGSKKLKKSDSERDNAKKKKKKVGEKKKKKKSIKSPSPSCSTEEMNVPNTEAETVPGPPSEPINKPPETGKAEVLTSIDHGHVRTAWNSGRLRGRPTRSQSFKSTTDMSSGRGLNLLSSPLHHADPLTPGLSNTFGKQLSYSNSIMSDITSDFGESPFFRTQPEFMKFETITEEVTRKDSKETIFLDMPLYSIGEVGSKSDSKELSSSNLQSGESMTVGSRTVGSRTVESQTIASSGDGSDEKWDSFIHLGRKITTRPRRKSDIIHAGNSQDDPGLIDMKRENEESIDKGKVSVAFNTAIESVSDLKYEASGKTFDDSINVFTLHGGDKLVSALSSLTLKVDNDILERNEFSEMEVEAEEIHRRSFEDEDREIVYQDPVSGGQLSLTIAKSEDSRERKHNQGASLLSSIRLIANDENNASTKSSGNVHDHISERNGFSLSSVGVQTGLDQRESNLLIKYLKAIGKREDRAIAIAEAFMDQGIILSDHDDASSVSRDTESLAAVPDIKFVGPPSVKSLVDTVLSSRTLSYELQFLERDGLGVIDAFSDIRLQSSIIDPPDESDFNSSPGNKSISGVTRSFLNPLEVKRKNEFQGEIHYAPAKSDSPQNFPVLDFENPLWSDSDDSILLRRKENPSSLPLQSAVSRCCDFLRQRIGLFSISK
jgi:hypothetical protein